MHGHELLDWRLAEAPLLRSRLSLLERDDVGRLAEQIEARFFDRGKWIAEAWPACRRLDLADFTPERVRQWFLSLAIPASQTVRLIWCSTELGVELRYAEFAAHYDDLWYPSSDDVWLTDASLSWLLEMDHEEVATYASLAS